MRLTFSLLAMAPAPAYRIISDSIRSDVLARRLIPGDRLPVEAELAERFGVSRSTVREALRDLTSQNLVVTTRGATGGTFVVVPRPEDITRSLSISIEMLTNNADLSVAQILEAREVLELPAAEMACARGTDDQIAEIREYLDSRRAAEDAGQELRTNYHFHTLVIRASNNPLILLMAEPILYVLESRFAVIDPPPTFQRQTEDDHRAIAAALEARDAERAVTLSRAHLDLLRPYYKEFDTRLGRT